MCASDRPCLSVQPAPGPWHPGFPWNKFPPSCSRIFLWLTYTQSFPSWPPPTKKNQQATSGSLAHSKSSLLFIVPLARQFPIDDAVNLLFICVFIYLQIPLLTLNCCLPLCKFLSRKLGSICKESMWVLSTPIRFQSPLLALAHLKWIRQNIKTFSKLAINSEKSRFSASKCGWASPPPLGTLSSQASQRM